jgi:hypothetical protein
MKILYQPRFCNLRSLRRFFNLGEHPACCPHATPWNDPHSAIVQEQPRRDPAINLEHPRISTKSLNLNALALSG